jgi:hypothetical protein
VQSVKCYFGKHVPSGSLYIPAKGQYRAMIDCTHCHDDVTHIYPEMHQKLMRMADSFMDAKND